MTKIIGLDIGDHRIGVAMAEGKLVASFGVITYESTQNALSEIIKIVRSNEVEKIVVGLPKNQDTFQMDKIRSFSMELAKQAKVPVDFVDESYTSLEAQKTLEKSKIDKKSTKYKEEVDKISAKIILQDYVQAQK